VSAPNLVKDGKTVLIRPDLVSRLRRIADRLHVPRTALVDQALREYLAAVEGGRAAFQEIK
jgi:predicted transcriptional regulator